MICASYSKPYDGLCGKQAYIHLVIQKNLGPLGLIFFLSMFHLQFQLT